MSSTVAWIRALSAASIALLGLGCDTGKPLPGERRNEVVIGVRGDTSSFNIYTATNAFTQDVVDLLYLKLANERNDFTAGPPGFEPALAQSWTLSPDGLELSLDLDPAARWSDGTPVTPADVIFSHSAATDATVAWVGADTKDFIEEIEALDAQRVRLRFSRSYPYALADAFEGNILPRHVFVETPFEQWTQTDFNDAPAANGPFLLSDYTPDHTIVLVRNPGFLAAPKPYLDSIVFRVIPDARTRVSELLVGGLDVLADVPEEDVERIEADGTYEVVRVADLSYAFVCWNTARPLFSDAAVRRALTLAIDRPSLIEGLLPRTGRPASGPIPSILWAHDASIEPWPYDPAAARVLLEEAGWSDTDGDGWIDRDGVPFRFELETNRESRLRTDLVEAISAQLERVGIQAVPRLLEFGATIDRHERREFDAFVSSWRESTKVDLKSVLHSSAIASGYNYGSFSDPEIDALIDRARVERDPQQARALWARVQQAVHQAQPYSFLFERDRLHAVHRDLEGFRPGPRSPYAGLEDWRWRSRGRP